MRLAAVRHPEGDHSLFVQVQTDGGWVDLIAAGRNLGIAHLDGVGDVGDVGGLYRLGPAAVASAGAVARSPLGGEIARSALEDLALGPPVRPASFVCIGRNYLEHIREGNVETPPYPILFSKFPNTLIGHGEGVRHHPLTTQLDYEGELAVMIGTRATRVPADRAMEFVGGYTIVNDVSARDLQYQDLQWIRGKSLDTWAPLGPVFVSAEEIPDPYALRVQTRVNGELRQDASCSDMIFKIAELVEFITAGITLQPGDLIATGTPSGVGLGFDPPRWLHAGDVVEVTIDPIGTLRSPIVG
jgi:2-keto-4-pentenoate hydratase/2-oxohepta-3-ene-1,7-dioic acid hydratase in catechol pathway